MLVIVSKEIVLLHQASAPESTKAAYFLQMYVHAHVR